MKLKVIISSILIFVLFAFSSFYLIDNFTNVTLKKDNQSIKKNELIKVSKKMKEYLALRGYGTDLEVQDLKRIYWAERIKDGGLILLFRHSEREKWDNSVEAFDTIELKNNLDARKLSWYKATCLTEKGIEESKLIGEAFKYANIKINLVISSPSCRAKETAYYAFNKIDYFFNGLLHYTAFHPDDRKKIGIQLKKAVLNLDLKKKSNIILSAHNNVINHYNFIDKMEVTKELNESGFIVIEKKDNQLIARYKFSEIKHFITMLYRHNFKIIKN